jgi:NADH-quinone oxidoreductase subunit L
MFHLMTHAFFKALLFLAAGSRSTRSPASRTSDDARPRRRMPYTRLVFLIGSLALVGIPPFAGFFSKDSILARCSTAARSATSSSPAASSGRS